MTDDEIMRFLDLRPAVERSRSHWDGMGAAAKVAGDAGAVVEAAVYGDVRERQMQIHEICGRYRARYPGVLSLLSPDDRREVERLVAG